MGGGDRGITSPFFFQAGGSLPRPEPTDSPRSHFLHGISCGTGHQSGRLPLDPIIDLNLKEGQAGKGLTY